MMGYHRPESGEAVENSDCKFVVPVRLIVFTYFTLDRNPAAIVYIVAMPAAACLCLGFGCLRLGVLGSGLSGLNASFTSFLKVLAESRQMPTAADCTARPCHVHAATAGRSCGPPTPSSPSRRQLRQHVDN